MHHHMKILKKLAFAAFVGFSIFCFCYLNMQKPSVPQAPEKVLSYEAEEQQGTEMYLPDVKFVARISEVIKTFVRIL